MSALNPREVIESQEAESERTLEMVAQEQAAFVMGRLLIWILSTGNGGAIGELGAIGLRAYVVAYRLRPDLIGGVTLAQIAERRGCSPQFVHGLAKDFSETFDVRSLSSKTHQHRKRMADTWSAAHPTTTQGDTRLSHLSIINRLVQWVNYGKYKKMDRKQLQQDFKPVLTFVQNVYRFD